MNFSKKRRNESFWRFVIDLFRGNILDEYESTQDFISNMQRSVGYLNKHLARVFNQLDSAVQDIFTESTHVESSRLTSGLITPIRIPMPLQTIEEKSAELKPRYTPPSRGIAINDEEEEIDNEVYSIEQVSESIQEAGLISLIEYQDSQSYIYLQKRAGIELVSGGSVIYSSQKLHKSKQFFKNRNFLQVLRIQEINVLINYFY